MCSLFVCIIMPTGLILCEQRGLLIQEMEVGLPDAFSSVTLQTVQSSCPSSGRVMDNFWSLEI